MVQENALFHLPVMVVSLLGLGQTLGLRRGLRWVYDLGVRVSRHEEEYAFGWAEKTDTVELDSWGLYPLGNNHFGLLDWRASMSTSSSGGGATTRGQGLLCFGVLTLERCPEGVRFVFERRVSLFGPASVIALLVALYFATRTMSGAGEFLLLALALFGGFTLAVTLYYLRRLSTAYEVLSAELAARLPQRA